MPGFQKIGNQLIRAFAFTYGSGKSIDMRNSIIWSLIILSGCGLECKSNNIELIIRFGDSLYAQESYEEALLEYQRAYFFASGEQKSLSGAKMAECYLLSDDFFRARSYYDSAISCTTFESSVTNYQFRKILCLILEKNFGYALNETDQLKVDSNSIMMRRKYLYQGICYFGLKKYKESHHFLRNSLPETDTVRIVQLQQLFENNKRLNCPNSALAIVLSVVLPGAGQIYSGNIRGGINSVLLLSGLLYIGSTLSASGLIIIIPFLYRYYIGGILNAKKAALEKQKEKQLVIFTNLSKFLLE